MARQDTDFIREPSRKIPVYKRVDVVVAGSGAAGLAATVAAARNGAKVLLVERNPFLGGMATASYQVYFGGGPDLMSGIAREMAQRLDKLGGGKYIERGRFPPAATGRVTPLTYHLSHDPEIWKYIASDMVEESGARALTNTWAVGALVENKHVKGITIENKSGRQAILADVTIDATGDADIAAMAGVTMDRIPKSGYLMGMVMLFRVGGVNYKKIADYARQHPEDFTPHTGVPPGDFDGTNAASIEGMGGWFSFVKEAKKKGDLPADWRSGWGREGFGICGVNPEAIKHGIAFFDIIHVFKRFPWIAEDVCAAELEGRKKIRTFIKFLKTVPGFEDAFLIDIAHSIGLQDSRRIIGEYVFTREDLRHGNTFDDTISMIARPWPDVPVSEDEGWMMHPADGSQGNETWQRQIKGAPYFLSVSGVPYRCLIPKGFDGLLVAGQTISMTYMAHEPGSSRGMPSCMHWGQAAGTAAAIAVKNKVSVRDVDIPTLRQTLTSQGACVNKDEVDVSELRRMYEINRGVKFIN